MPPRSGATGRPSVLCSDACKRAKDRDYQSKWRELHRDAIRERARVCAKKRANKQRAWLRSKLSENPEYQREIHRRWKERNTDRDKERQRRWRLAHSEQEKARQREYQRKKRATNPVPVEQKRASDKRYYERLKANPARLELVKPKRRAQNNSRRARKLQAFVERVDPAEIYRRDAGVCGICEKPVSESEKWHVDHVVPLARGGAHSYDNCQLAHARCNQSKNATIPRGQGNLFQRAG
jgi:5-methylcytosine-specific restriction endonuclease McrA